MDQDYIHLLSDKEKQWLSNFMEEELGANFHHKGKKLNKTKADKRRCYGNNNARNRCLYSIAKATGYLSEFDPGEIDKKQKGAERCVEDNLIDELDKKSSGGSNGK